MSKGLRNSAEDLVSGAPEAEKTPYALSNEEEEEQKRLQEIQICHRTFWGTNIHAPIVKEPKLIVDVGTGSGLWAKEVAEEFPSAKVVGTDIATVKLTNVPSNCEFKVESLLDGLSFATDSVDLLHCRALISAIAIAKWPEYVAEVYRVLKPGAWATFVEVNPIFISENNSRPADSALDKWMQIFYISGPKQRGITLDLNDIKGFVKTQPWDDVKVDERAMPVGEWPDDAHMKEVGKLAVPVFSRVVSAVDPITKLVFPHLTDDQRAGFNQQVMKDIENPEYRHYVQVCCIIARKPAA